MSERACDTDRYACAGDLPTSADIERAPSGARPTPLAVHLSRLGSVLWLVRRGAASPRRRAVLDADGVLLLEHPALAPLATCAHVTCDAPEIVPGALERLTWRDARGVAQARLHLLPDTDWLAWEQLARDVRARSSCVPESTSPWQRALSLLRPRWTAWLLNFHTASLPWLRLLDARAPQRLSTLGLQHAQRVAALEGAAPPQPLGPVILPARKRA